MKYLIFIILIFIFFSNANSQERIKLKNIKGSCEIKNISPEEAKQKAILEAKIEALRKAGIKETITNSDFLTTQTTSIDCKQAFTNISNVEINGEIIDYEIVSEEKRIDEFKNLFYDVMINAEVIKYDKKPDASFDFKVDGVELFYKNLQVLKFEFTPYQNGYLKIFNFSGDEGSIIYPYYSDQYRFLNDYPDRFFRKNETVKFPINQNMGNPTTKEVGYLLETDKEKETNHLVFVFTKKNIPFKKVVNFKNIIQYIYSISPDEREVKYFGFLIVNKKD